MTHSSSLQNLSIVRRASEASGDLEQWWELEQARHRYYLN